MNDLNPFQMIFLAVFTVFAVAGVAVFAVGGLAPGGGSGQQSVSFEVWGTLEKSSFNKVMETGGVAANENIKVSYTNIDGSNFHSRLVNALARNEGPDVLLVPHSRLLELQDFLTTVKPEFYPTRKFKNTFVEGSEIFLNSQGGVRALPFAMDPLVMYWNRDLLSNAGFVSPPQYWSDMSEYVNRITHVGEVGNISQSAVALGTSKNIGNAKAILSSLILEAGNPIVRQSSADKSSADNAYTSVLSEGSDSSSLGGQLSPAEASLRLYTQYANPVNKSYTWNSSFTSARRAFTSNQVAMYFDTGRAVDDIRAQNPNLNFDVTNIPQRADVENKRTFATIYGFTILKGASNKPAIFSALQRMTNAKVANAIADQTNLTPVRKEVIAAGRPNDPHQSVLFDAAVIARGWYDPDPEKTQNVFETMIRDVTSGRQSVTGAVRDANNRINALLQGNNRTEE